MSAELRENIINLIHYYSHYNVGKMIASHPGFVEQDFAELLARLEKEILS